MEIANIPIQLLKPLNSSPIMNTTITEFNCSNIPLLVNFRTQLSPQKIFENSERDEYGDLDIYTYSPIHSFLSRLHTTNFVLQFDHNAWLKEQASGVDVLNTSYLKKADLETLRKIISTHLRKDKLREGHLAQLFESGYFVLFLEALEKWK